MKDSTRRSLRTLYQGVLASFTVVPVLCGALLSALPSDSSFSAKIGVVAAAFVAGQAVVTKLVNDLEERGLIPAWLKEPSQVVESDVVEGEFP